jgi:predicted RNase H-like HicB family nuclease
MKYMKYVVVIERSENGFGAYVPDLAGCAAVGDTVEETRRLLESAVAMHFTGEARGR